MPGVMAISAARAGRAQFGRGLERGYNPRALKTGPLIGAPRLLATPTASGAP